VRTCEKQFRINGIVFDVVCLFLCFKDETRKYCVRRGTDKNFCFKVRGEEMECRKQHSEELHDLYWAVNVGGWCTEREWGKWEKRNSL